MGRLCKAPVCGPDSARYLSRYTHRVAISNRRLIAADAHRQLPLEGLSHQRPRPLEDNPAPDHGVHPPLPPARAAERLPPHPPDQLISFMFLVFKTEIPSKIPYCARRPQEARGCAIAVRGHPATSPWMAKRLDGLRCLGISTSGRSGDPGGSVAVEDGSDEVRRALPMVLPIQLSHRCKRKANLA